MQLLESLTDDTATAAVTKRNNPTILPIIPTLLFVFPSTDIYPEIIWYNMDLQALQNHLDHTDLQWS
jgi:hypothetical protein